MYLVAFSHFVLYVAYYMSSMYSLCCYYLNVYILKYTLPWYTSHIIFHSCILLWISCSPHIIVPIQLIVIYISPHFIDTDHTTDVSQSANTSHISYILYALSLGVVQYEQVVVRFLFKLMLVWRLYKTRFSAYHMCMSSWAEWEGPYWPMKCTRDNFTCLSVS